jgi:pteridine reductase
MTPTSFAPDLDAIRRSDAPLALVTGAARRVGRAIALELARRGFDILIHSNASAADAHTLRAEIHARGRHAALWHLDLADLNAVDAAAAQLAAALPRLDILIHNASIYAPTPLATLTPADITRSHAINAGAPLLLTRHLAPLLAHSPLPGGASIVAMLDIHAMGLPRRDFTAYAMSKAALHEMVRSLARDLAPRTRVNGVAPGVVAWPEQGYESNAEAQAAYLARIPLQRAGTPDDAAGAVTWLALDATYLTGHVIRVDGGRSLL